jgi:microcystin-dependent protein
MSEPYVGEIRIFGGNFAPVGWMLCQGQTLPIAQYETLFNLIGTTYGGNGQTTFNLPNLQGRLPVHQGSGFVIGQEAGTETVTLNVNQIPAHSHVLRAQSTTGNVASPSGAVWASSALDEFTTATPSSDYVMAPSALGNAGGSQSHQNMSPFVVVNFIISLFGVYPSQG